MDTFKFTMVGLIFQKCRRREISDDIFFESRQPDYTPVDPNPPDRDPPVVSTGIFTTKFIVIWAMRSPFLMVNDSFPEL